MTSPKKILKQVYYQSYIQNTVLKVISPVYPEPYLELDAELRFGLWNITSFLFQPNKRQLGEDNVFQAIRKKPQITEYRVSKLEGSRKGKIANMTALKDIMLNWQSTMEVLASIRQHYVETLQIKTTTFNAADLMMFTKHVIALPVFMVRNNEDGNSDGIVDIEMATIYQLVGGGFTLIKKALEDIHTEVTLESVVTPEWLYDYGEKVELFTTPSTGQVCGGTRKKILELLDFLIYGNDGEQTYKASDQLLYSRTQNPEKYLSYSLSVFQMEIVLKQCGLASVDLFSSLDSIKYDQKIREWRKDSDIFSGQLNINDSDLRALLHHRLEMRNTLVNIIVNRRRLIEKFNPKMPFLKEYYTPLIVLPESKITSLKDAIYHYEKLLSDCESEINILQQHILNLLGCASELILSTSIKRKKLHLFKLKQLRGLL